MNSQGLWNERFTLYSKELQKYLKYIFNGHLVFVMIIALGGLGYYYSEWIKTLDSSFPAALIISIVLGILMTRSPVSTFLKEADMVFLLALETKLTGYFKRSIILSIVLQSFLLFIVFIVSMPIYSKVTNAGSTEFLTILGLMIITKCINIGIHWYVLKYQEKSTARIDALIRLVLNIVLLYFALANVNILLIIAPFILLSALLVYYKKSTRTKSLKWEVLIELEGKRMMNFYRFANLFTDVPSLRGKVARRKWLDWLLVSIPYSPNSSYLYLYARTMLRTNDYAGLLVRLTVIGAVIMMAFPSIWATVFITVLFLYMTGIQLLPVWRQHELKIWVSLYPLPAKMRQEAVVRLVSYFLCVEVIAFTIVMLVTGRFMAAAASAAAGVLFVIFFKGYSRKRMTSF